MNENFEKTISLVEDEMINIYSMDCTLYTKKIDMCGLYAKVPSMIT